MTFSKLGRFTEKPYIMYNEQNDKMQLHKYMNIIKVKQATLATMMILKSNKIRDLFKVKL